MAASQAPWQVRATARYVRRSPRKVQLVVNEIRGLTVPEARTVLAFMPQAGARDVAKVLSAAAANAEANYGLISDELIVHEAYVGQGPSLRRFRARARGRVGRIRKPTCHIEVALSDPPELWDESEPLESVVQEPPVVLTEEAEPEVEEAVDEAEVGGEPYEGYADETAKEVIARVKELDDEPLLLVQRLDTRKTVQRAVVAELGRRDIEVPDEDDDGDDAAPADADAPDGATSDAADTAPGAPDDEEDPGQDGDPAEASASGDDDELDEGADDTPADDEPVEDAGDADEADEEER